MKHKYKFSIIIPVYNLEKLIVPTLDSLFLQTLGQENFEVIITDDHSTDNTLSIVRDYHKLINLKVFQTPKNSGPGIARNNSISKAKGEYLIFLDGDDFLVFNALEKLNNFLRVKQYDLVSFNWAYTSNAQQPCNSYLKETVPASRHERLKNFLNGNMDGSVIYSLIRTDLVKKNNIQFLSGIHEDISFFCWMLFFSEKIGVFDQIVYLKNDREGSIVNSFSYRHLTDFLTSWSKILDFISLDCIPEDISHAYARGMNGMIVAALRRVRALDEVESRRHFYDMVITILRDDKYLNLNDINSFPNLTRKDRIARYFLELYLDNELDHLDKAKKLDTFLVEQL